MIKSLIKEKVNVVAKIQQNQGALGMKSQGRNKVNQTMDRRGSEPV